jgi:hypothetical protein
VSRSESDTGAALGQALLESLYGVDAARRLRTLKARANFVREHREAYEDGLDDLLNMLDRSDRLEPQEMRVAGLIDALVADRRVDAGASERTATLLALLIERMATLSNGVRHLARAESEAQATPVAEGGTHA